MTTNDQATTGRCAWCAAPASEGQTHCPACGASLSQRETVGNLVIPGVTHVDPNLESYAAQPMRIAGASPSQSAAAGVIEALAAGGGPGLTALGALAAMAATEYLGANRSHPGAAASIEKLGQPSQAALEMAQRLDGRPVGEAASADLGSYATPTTSPSDAGRQSAPPVRTETFDEMLKRIDARLAPDAASERGNEAMPADTQ